MYMNEFGQQQIITFCGADRCGKTNISTALSILTGIKRFKASNEHKTFLNKQNDFILQLEVADTRMLDFIKQTETSVIFDRSWPCEYVYSKFFKRTTNLEVLKFIDESYAKLGASIILCRRKSFAGIQDDLDDRLKQDNLEIIDSLYEDFKSFTKCPVFTLWVDDEDLKSQVTSIREWLKLEQKMYLCYSAYNKHLYDIENGHIKI